MTGRLGRALFSAIAATPFTCAHAQAGPADLDLLVPLIGPLGQPARVQPR